MCAPENLPSPPPSDNEYYESDDSESSHEPRLTPQELGALFIDFYTFMATLNYDISDLKIPPRTGWPDISSESCGGTKSDYAVEVIRHLPYFDSKGPCHIHYKSKLWDLTTWTPDKFKQHREDNDWLEFWSSEDEQDHSDVICIAEGYESYGRDLWLLVKDGEIVENMVRADILSSVPVEEYFATLKEQYETLQLIPGKGRVTIEADDILEHNERVSEEDVNGQTEEWGTDLDVQYLRQIYRDHGWPYSFDSEAAFKTVDNWLEPEGLEDGCDGPRGYAWEEQSR
ncbi:hypothetical protein FSHL1_010124 [Fusarium sambucinum]